MQPLDVILIGKFHAIVPIPCRLWQHNHLPLRSLARGTYVKHQLEIRIRRARAGKENGRVVADTTISVVEGSGWGPQPSARAGECRARGLYIGRPIGRANCRPCRLANKVEPSNKAHISDIRALYNPSPKTAKR
jgi:hypothetical protein